MKFNSLIFAATFVALLRNIDANPIDISTNASTLHSVEEIPKHIRSNILWAMAESFGVAFQKLKEKLFPEYYRSEETPLGSLGPLMANPELTLSEVTSAPERDVGAEWDSDKAFASTQTDSTSKPVSILEKLYDANVSSGTLVSTDPAPVPFEAPKKKHGGGGDLPIIRSEGAAVDSANDTSTRSLKTVRIPLDMRMNGSIAAVWEEGDASCKDDDDQVLLPYIAILPVQLGPYSTTAAMENRKEETLTTTAEQESSKKLENGSTSTGSDAEMANDTPRLAEQLRLLEGSSTEIPSIAIQPTENHGDQRGGNFVEETPDEFEQLAIQPLESSVHGLPEAPEIQYDGSGLAP